MRALIFFVFAVQRAARQQRLHGLLLKPHFPGADIKSDGVFVNVRDFAEDAAAGDDFVADRERGEHVAVLLGALLLRADEQKIKHHQYQNQRQKLRYQPPAPRRRVLRPCKIRKHSRILTLFPRHSRVTPVIPAQAGIPPICKARRDSRLRGNDGGSVRITAKMNTALLIKLLVNGVIVGALYGVVAMSFVLIYKASKVVNFAQGEFLILGAFVCFWLATSLELPFYAAFVGSVLFMLVFGAALQYVVLRPMVGEPVISVIMVTVGLAFFFQALLKWLFGVDTSPLPPVFDTATVDIAGLRVETAYLLILGASAVTIALFYWFFTRSRTGLAMRATAFDQQAAQSLGISVEKMFGVAWAISAAVSAIAGITLGAVNGVSTQLAFTGIKVFPAVILGGLESVPGGVVGGIVIGVLENLAEFIDGQYLHWGNMYEIAPFYILIAILMIKPHGFWGTEDIERV